MAPAGGTYLRACVGRNGLCQANQGEALCRWFRPVQGRTAHRHCSGSIRDQHGIVIGGLGLGFPAGDYTRSLTLTRVGDSGETFAFDRDFFMLSCPDPSRLLTLVDKGLLADASQAQLNVQVRVPRKVGNRYTVEGQPATQIALAAVENGGGCNLDGYLNYLGTPVIGASKWLEELDFGICKEISVDEAYRPVRDIDRLIWGLLGLMIITAGLAIGTSFRNVRLHQARQDLRQIGPYTLGEKIAQGGMGTIYRCQHALLRPAAMKLLDGHQASGETVARFEREVQIASELTHPHTVQIYDFGRTDDDIFYIAMELLPGLDLNQLVTLSGPQTPARVIHILRQASEALREAHRRGLIHRDIKPGNIMLCERGGNLDFVKVLDYGLARSFKINRMRAMKSRAMVGCGYAGLHRSRTADGQGRLSRRHFFLGCRGLLLIDGAACFSRDRFRCRCDASHLCGNNRRRPPPLSSTEVPDPLAGLIVRCLTNGGPRTVPPISTKSCPCWMN